MAMDYTKNEYQQLLIKLILPLKGKYSNGCADLYLGGFAAGYGIDIANMEAFSRVLWGLAPYWAGGGVDDDFKKIYNTGFKNGTDPEHLEYWGEIGNKDQRMVEMAALSYSILMSPDITWNPLDDQTKKNVIAWLSQINEFSQADNNWHFFNTITNLALKSVGAQYSIERMEYAIGKYESFYLSNGWYSDGVRPQKDYYISFAIHFYCLIYAKFMKKDNPVRSRCYKERAGEFAKTFLYWFDDEGKALPFGRSLTYRFAQAAFWSAYLLAEVEGMEVGVVKGILNRHLDYWMKQPIFDNGGVLTVGYTYPNLLISEGYNAAGSPYWALKAFAFLALPDDHPFWHVKAESYPDVEKIKPIKECDMLIQHREGEVTALTAGQYPVMNHTCGAEKYAKFAYSSKYGFSISRSYYILEECAPDSMLVFQVYDMYYVRRKCLNHEVTGQSVTSTWSPLDGIVVETELIPTKEGHIRKHKINSNIVCEAYDCGFAYPIGNNEKQVFEGTSACVYDSDGYSRVLSKEGEGLIISSVPNTNLIHPLTRIPAVKYIIKQGLQCIETIIQSK